MSIFKSKSHARRVRVGIVGGIAVAAIVLLGAASCGGSSGGSQSAVNASNTTAQKEYNEFTAAVPYPYADSAPSNPLERENLAKRLEQLNSKGDTNYVYIETFAGQVVGYYVIDGKVSSTGSEMTSTEQVSNCGTQNNGDGGGWPVRSLLLHDERHPGGDRPTVPDVVGTDRDLLQCP